MHERGQRIPAASILAGLLTLAVLVPRAADAHSTGEVGHSGKQGPICNECHSGGTAPTVTFDGPTAVAVGETATYRLTVQSARATQRAAGVNVAVSAGTLAPVANQGEQLITGELTHTAPQNNVDGAASWQFTWTAPDAAGEVTLFGAGNSVNRNGQSTGDRASATTLAVMVMAAATPSPTATPLPSPTDTAPPTVAASPTDTRTPGPTRTPGGACAGDCDGSDTVAVNELVTGVGIALGSAAADACPALDGNADGQVSISELIAAVASLLDGCP